MSAVQDRELCQPVNPCFNGPMNRIKMALARFLDRIAPVGYQTSDGFFYGPIPADQREAVVAHERVGR